MAEHAKPTRPEMEARLIDKAWKDPAFRRALIEDPNGTLERELGLTVPAGVSLTVLEETPTNRYLVLPPGQTGAVGELSDADLAAVAGGDPASGQTEGGYCVSQAYYTAYCLPGQQGC
jgi:hypothetical protein